MRVLHLVKTSTGAVWALRQMRELAKLGIEVHVALPDDGCLVDEYRENGIVVHPIDYNLKKFGKTARRLRAIVRKVRPDLIHSHFVLTTLIGRITLRRFDIPRIFQVPGPLHLENFLTRSLEYYLADKRDYWIASCNWTRRRYIRSGVGENRVFLSFYGSDIIAEMPQGRGKLYDLTGEPQTAKLIGMVAYMYPPKKYLGYKRGIKGHEDFIDAMEILCKKYDDICGVCIGGAWDGAVEYEQAVKKYAASRKGKVVFLGTRNDVKELYPDLFCVVHPSLSENLGGAGESLGFKIPTIATRVGGFPDVVIPDKTGILITPRCPEEIADAVSSYIENPDMARKLAENGQKLVRELLKLDNTVETVTQAYKKILEDA